MQALLPASLLAHLGHGLHRNPWPAAEPSSALLYMPKAAQSPVARFCVEYSDFWWEDCGPNLRNETPGALTLYAEACEERFWKLEPAQRALLEPLVGTRMTPEVGLSFLRRGERPFNALMYRFRSGLASAKTRRELPQEPKSSADYLREVRPLTAWPPPDWLRTLEGVDKLGSPMPAPKIEPSEVLSTLQRGRVATFDATKVLPLRMFNVTLADIAKRHGMEQRNIPYRSFAPSSSALKTQACLAASYSHWREHAADVHPTTVCQPLPSLAQTKHELLPSSGRINVRRLPRWMDPQNGLVESLGLGDVVQRDMGNLIVGSAVGGVHWDEPDNIFINMAGLAVVWLMPTEYAPAAINMKCTTPTWDKFMQQDAWTREVPPYHLVVLRPGDAVVIPSGALHAVYGDAHRLSINTFLEPKFNRMRWPGAPSSWWQRDSQVRLALRNLWVQSLGRVWDTKKVGLYAQGAGMELL